MTFEEGLFKLLSTINDIPIYTTIVSIHGWGLIDSRNESTSSQMASMLYYSMKSLFPRTTVYRICIVNDGDIQQRTDKCLKDLNLNIENLKKSTLVLFVAHSQGAIVSSSVISKLYEDNILSEGNNSS